MKIATWNVNGIRALKKSVKCVLVDLQSDITCFQETKINRSSLPEDIALIDGYTSYFSYHRKQSGYSGVASYCRNQYNPEDAEEGLSGQLDANNHGNLADFTFEFELSSFDFTDLDSEGRVIITYHLIKFEDEIKRLAVINVYCPRVDPDKPERHTYKLQFCKLLEAKAINLCKKNCFVVIVGDMNIAYSIIDHCDPGDENEFNSSEARQWMNLFLSCKGDSDGEIGMIDAFRYLYPDKKNAYTCWNIKTGARSTNYGTRIDYVLISKNLAPLLLDCEILSQYHGSDHCPVRVELKCEAVSSERLQLPAICTRLWPEFAGRQQKLQMFLQKPSISSNCVSDRYANPTVQTMSVNKNSLKRKNNQKSIVCFFKTNSNSKDDNMTNSLTDNCSKEDSEILSESNNDGQSDETPVSKSVCLENSQIQNCSTSKSSQAMEWKSVLKGPPKPPLCSGHNKLSVLRTVKKKGPNYGRQFFMCAQPAGHSSNPDANCNFFKWVSAPKINTLKPS